MKLTLEMTAPDGTAPHLLRKVAEQIAAGYTERGILDVNGNTVGAWSLVTTDPFSVTNVPVLFNMTLANGSATERFCIEAAATLRDVFHVPCLDEVLNITDEDELSDLIDTLNDRIGEAGGYVHWTAGDVIVYDLRNLEEEEREAFFESIDIPPSLRPIV